MKAAEKNLMLAARNQLRLPQPTGGGYAADQCDVEFDEMAPATVGDIYLAVIPGGWRPGPRHNTSGGVNDLVYSVLVAVVRRIGNVPRDRRRDVFLNNLNTLDDDIDKVYSALDWKYEVMNAANALILTDTTSTQGFIEPLRLVGDVGRPRLVDAEFFGGKEGVAGMMRILPFGGARRITTKA
ncbi:MAG: hypothetical protein ACREUY_04455 [Burkholderiales bacterium]